MKSKTTQTILSVEEARKFYLEIKYDGFKAYVMQKLLEDALKNNFKFSDNANANKEYVTHAKTMLMEIEQWNVPTSNLDDLF